MRKLHFAALVLSATCSSLPAFAHDAKFHKERPVEGTITQLSGESLNLKTEAGSQEVTLTKDTKIETKHGKEGSPASKDDLKVGAHLTVFGTKLESGQLVAKEVMVSPSQH